MENIFFEITVVIFLASLLTIIFRFLKQPSVLAFIVTGIIVGPLGVFNLEGHELMRSLASIGITLLLFMIGLELNLKELKSVGRNALIAGFMQMGFTSVAGFGISLLLGFSSLTSVYVGIALAFSSTILIIKLLSDKRDLKSLYGKLTVGILLIQDLIAIFILILLSTFSGVSGTSINFFEVGIAALKVVVLFGWVIFLSREILPKILNIIARNSESLFLFSLAWVFGIAALVSSSFIGFSIEIGGLLAGIALATSIESYQIITKVKPLRDFFLTIFFVTLGMDLKLNNLSEIIVPVIVFSGFVLFISPIIIMMIFGFLKYKKRTGFMSGIALAQISEFSLIMLYLGNKIGHIPENIISIITIVGVVTFVVSTYFIIHANFIYKLLMPYLNIFERKNISPESKIEELKGHIILVGANRMGEGILNVLINKKENFVVVDFDPDIISKLKNKKIEAFFGDISDPEIAQAVNVEMASLIISTASDPEDNLLLLKSLKSKKGPKIIVAAFEKSDAKEFYKNGADYVIMPHIAGGNHLAKILVDDNHLELIEEYKNKEKNYIS